MTHYSAFTEFYGTGYHHIKVIPEHPRDAAQQLFTWMRLHAAESDDIKILLANNKKFVQSRFPEKPWSEFMDKLQ